MKVVKMHEDDSIQKTAEKMLEKHENFILEWPNVRLIFNGTVNPEQKCNG